MKEKEKIFLSRHQVLEAIRADFNQYDSQFPLFQELCPIVTDNHSIVTREGRNDCVLISRGKKSKTRHLTDGELSRYLIDKIAENCFSLPKMAEICGKVFQTRSWTGRNAEGGNAGIWIETDMSGFTCRQCGNCCRNLNYHNDCTEDDFKLWEMLGRDDIMEKVMIIRCEESGISQYKIWKKPGTTQLYPECPWLAPASGSDRYKCLIQDVKPEYCRQYPLTRKHAEMTGCRGIFCET